MRRFFARWHLTATTPQVKPLMKNCPKTHTHPYPPSGGLETSFELRSNVSSPDSKDAEAELRIDVGRVNCCDLNLAGVNRVCIATKRKYTQNLGVHWVYHSLHIGGGSNQHDINTDVVTSDLVNTHGHQRWQTAARWLASPTATLRGEWQVSIKVKTANCEESKHLFSYELSVCCHNVSNTGYFLLFEILKCIID